MNVTVSQIDGQRHGHRTNRQALHITLQALQSLTDTLKFTVENKNKLWKGRQGQMRF